MKQYHDLCEHILKNGTVKDDRTGTGTISVFGYQTRFDLQEGFPLLTTKRVPFRLIFEELKWFLNGDTNIKYLLDKNVNIWNADAYRVFKQNCKKKGLEILTEDQFIFMAKRVGFDLGPIYGKQWRSWEDRAGMVIDQIANVINEIKTNPDSRRLIVTAWNPGDLKKMALPPCHVIFQFYVLDGKLSCLLFQRSGDVFLGVPFNIASYALLTHMIAKECDLEVGEFIHTLGDAHIYLNHVDQVKEQLTREPKELPKLILPKKSSIDDYVWEDVVLEGYNPHSAIKGDVSVG